MNETLILEIIFWSALFMVFYTYLGYGIVLYALVKLKELFVKPVKRVLPPDSDLPEVTLFITAFNEEDVVDEKMENSLALDYPADKLRIAMKGYTIAYCTNAYAIESGSADMGEEEKRKVRIAAGGLQSIWRLRPLLNPFHYGILSFQYTSHRVLRWSVTPFLLFALLPLNIVVLLLGESPLFYGTLLGLQILFYGMGYWGYYLSTRQIKNKVLFIPYYFLFMNVNVLKGIGYLKRKKGSGAWEKAKRAEK